MSHFLPASKLIPQTIFMNLSLLTENGSASAPTAGAGIRLTSNPVGVPIARGIGNGPTAGGIGSAMSHGPGPAITTAPGWMTQATVGAGSRAPNGLRHG